MKKAKNIISAVAALCFCACILPSCYVKISDKAKEEIKAGIEDGSIIINGDLDLDFGNDSDTLEMPDTLGALDSLEELESFEDLDSLIEEII